MIQQFRTGLALIRAVIPPWRDLDHLPEQRISPNWWIVLIVGGLILLIGLIYTIKSASDYGGVNPDLYWELIAIALFGLMFMGSWLHWRLVLSIIRRAAEFPISDNHTQIAGLGWQISPALRQLILIQIGTLLLSAAYLIAWPVYALMLIPFGVLMLLFQIIEIALVAVIAFRARNSHPYSALFSTYLSRALITGVFLALISLIWLTQISVEDDGMDGAILFTILLVVTIGSLLLAFVTEWLPLAIPMPTILILALAIGLDENPDTKISTGEFALLYFGMLIAVIAAYLMLPIKLIGWFDRRTARSNF